jgi:hypothetical protein
MNNKSVYFRTNTMTKHQAVYICCSKRTHLKLPQNGLEKHSTNKSVNPNTCVAVAEYQPTDYPRQHQLLYKAQFVRVLFSSRTPN